MTKCKFRGANTHRTRDEVSPAAIKMLQVGAFPAGHAVICNCMMSEGKMKPEDCDGLTVYNGDNAEVARFTGKQFRAQQGEDGTISVWALPSTTTQDRNYRPCRDYGERLAALNTANVEFWRSRCEEQTAASTRTSDGLTPQARLNLKHAEFYKQEEV